MLQVFLYDPTFELFPICTLSFSLSFPGLPGRPGGYETNHVDLRVKDLYAGDHHRVENILPVGL